MKTLAAVFTALLLCAAPADIQSVDQGCMAQCAADAIKCQQRCSSSDTGCLAQCAADQLKCFKTCE